MDGWAIGQGMVMVDIACATIGRTCDARHVLGGATLTGCDDEDRMAGGGEGANEGKR